MQVMERIARRELPKAAQRLAQTCIFYVINNFISLLNTNFMKTTLFSAAILAVVALAMSCGSSAKAKTTFRPDALPSEWHNINPDKDTTLVLESGMQIIIAAGSIQPSGKPAKMEIKQALTMYDILRAGLTTQSNKSPLSSGGMMYLGFEDKNTKLAKPIRVKMPTTRIVEGMERFRGEVDKDGNLNWVEPKPLVEDEMAKERQKLAQTKQLFTDYCASCHNIANPVLPAIEKAVNSRPIARPQLMQKPMVKDSIHHSEGSLIPLAHLYKYREQKWLLAHLKTASAYVHNLPECPESAKMSSPATKNPRNLTDEELIRIFDYIEATSEADGIPVPPFNAELCKTDCAKKQQQYDALMMEIDTLRKISNEIEAQAGKKSEELTEKLKNVRDYMVSVTNGGTERHSSYNGGNRVNGRDTTLFVVMPTARKSSYYCFDIEAPGYWLNVDLRMWNVIPNVNLVANVTAPRLDRIEVFLVVPSEKMFIRAGVINAEQTKYMFFETNGNIPLPKGRAAWIYSVGEEKGEFYLGLQPFTVAQDNIINLKVAVSSQQKIEAALKQMSGDLDMKISESGRRATDKLEAEIADLDAEKEKLSGQIINISVAASRLYNQKPAACICECDRPMERNGLPRGK
jgi:hypothetical protein